MNKVMEFTGIVGNFQAKKYLSSLISKGTIERPLLFAGMDGIGKGLLAAEFAKSLISAGDQNGAHSQKIHSGNHPDLRVYRPEGKLGMHSIDSIRGFIEEVYLAPYEADWKVFIIHEADRMLPYSANALLKTLEEPYFKSIIILLTCHPDKLLPTILSRCQKVIFKPLQVEEVHTFIANRYAGQTHDFHKLAANSKGSIGKACQWIELGGDPLRDQLIAFLAKGKEQSYLELSELIQSISSYFDELKKKIEEMTHKEFTMPTLEMTAQQKADLEKEVEGAVSSRMFQEVQTLTEAVREWHRDLELLAAGGSSKFLLLKDYENEF